MARASRGDAQTLPPPISPRTPTTTMARAFAHSMDAPIRARPTFAPWHKPMMGAAVTPAATTPGRSTMHPPRCFRPSASSLCRDAPTHSQSTITRRPAPTMAAASTPDALTRRGATLTPPLPWMTAGARRGTTDAPTSLRSTFMSRTLRMMARARSLDAPNHRAPTTTRAPRSMTARALAADGISRPTRSPAVDVDWLWGVWTLGLRPSVRERRRTTTHSVNTT